MFIDTHVHLNSDKLYKDLDNVITRAHQENVTQMIVVGYDKTMNQRAIEIAHQYPFIYAVIGYHPVGAENRTEEDYLLLEEQLKDDKVVGIGECGLDFHWDKEHIDAQVTSLIRHIELSKKTGKPLTIHMREATLPIYNVLKEHAPVRGVMHCYSGSAEMALKFIECGLYISLAGPVTFLNAKTPKEVAKSISLNHLLIETDAPYLAPHPYRGKQNEPSYIPLIAKAIADIKQISIEDVAKATERNAMLLFALKENRS